MIYDELRRALVTIQTEGGLVISGRAKFAQLNQSFDDGVNEWSLDIEMDCVGEILVSKDEFIREVEQKQASDEWRCEYCGTVNDKHDKSCTSCRAPRHFLYDL